MKETKLKVDMHCATCGIKIGKALKKVGVKSNINPTFGICKVEFDEEKISEDDVIKTIEKVGYNVTKG